ncbi:MAG: S-methyl-5-thioribose-1-phosphate isomerase [Thermoleophilia bacterium]
MRTIEWRDGTVVMIDQRRLPLAEEYVACATWEEVAEAIRWMVIRGAPAIGVAAAMGMALAARTARGLAPAAFEQALQAATKGLFLTRPTAVNLGWALAEMERVWRRPGLSPAEIAEVMERRALEIYHEDLDSCRSIGAFGAELVTEDEPVILTHCNAGALATAGYGTALGVIRAVSVRRPKLHVLVDETRPFLQGARLTAWELMHECISAELITDSMAGYFLSQGIVTQVVVGADRIAANGDTANKIGTYTLSVLAREHGVPFYVAAPLSTVDLAIPDGGHIPIEERDESEVTHVGGRRVAPVGVRVRNPAFDVTPARNVTAIITERGVARPPFAGSLARLAAAAGEERGGACAL